MVGREETSGDQSVWLLKARRFGDTRGWFEETFSDKRMQSLGIDLRFVQDNQSFSAGAGTLRGIHFQRPPFAQAKLVRCVRGRILDVAVDLRRGSPTFGNVVSAELTAAVGEQLFVPVGFGHGFVTLEPDCEVAYKVSAPYAPECEGGIIWNDPDIGIDWPVPDGGPVLSAKDLELPALATFDSPFTYTGGPLQLLSA